MDREYELISLSYHTDPCDTKFGNSKCSLSLLSLSLNLLSLSLSLSRSLSLSLALCLSILKSTLSPFTTSLPTYHTSTTSLSVSLSLPPSLSLSTSLQTLSIMLYSLSLLSSGIWFGMAFRFFSFQQETSAKLLVPRSQRSSPLFNNMKAGVRFLGGMNASLSFLSFSLLYLHLSNSVLFSHSLERSLLLLSLSIAHLSQFLCNVPVIIVGEEKRGKLWNVLSGPMLYIFIIDGLQTILNGGVAVILYTQS